jgi:alpha-methylacyl-CoA racemase
MMSVGALEPKFWKELVEALGAAHLIDEAFADGDAAARVHAELEAVFLTRTRAEWAAHLAGRDVCCEPVLTFDEVFANEQVQHRRLRIDPGVGGPTAQLGFPFTLSATPPSVRRPAPGYGEHTRELLTELGYDGAAVGALVAEGATE